MSKISKNSSFKAKLKKISQPALYGTVGAVAAAALITPVAVSAQEEVKQLETVFVTGTRGALKQAIDTKRNAGSVIDAVSAEDVGKFPDKNLAESLQRVPGVTINRGFSGEGNEVSIRGVNPELTHTTVNGQFVSSTEWFSLGANNRSFNMDLLPSEIVSSIEVHKSPTASQDEGGIGGSVVVRTRRPLDQEDELTVFASIETNTNSLADTDDTGTGATGYISWKNDSDTFGASAMVHTNEIIGRGDKGENYWEEAWSAIGASEFRQNRERQTFDITLQFAPDENQSYTLQYLDTQIDMDNINQNFLVINANDITASTSRVAPNAGCCGRAAVLPLAGTVNGAANLAQDANSRKPELGSELLHFTGKYSGDGWNLSYEAGKTEASGGNGGNVNFFTGLGAFAAGSGVTVGFNADLPNHFTANLNGISATDASSRTILGISLAETVLTDEESFVQADLSFDVDWGAFFEVKTGLKTRSHEQTQNLINSTVTLPAGATVASLGLLDGTASLSNEVCQGNFCDYARIDQAALHSVGRQFAGVGVVNPDSFGKVEEDIDAFYVQGNFETDKLRGNIGFRYVDTEVTGTSSYNVLVSDYSEVLPSFNLAYDLSDDLILRTSLARVMSRAGYNSLNPAFSGIANVQGTASQGNSAIDPFLADQADIGLEWYFDEGSIASAFLFHKDIESFVSSTTEVRNITQAGVTAPFRTTIPIQGLGGSITGLEMQLQKQWDNGFGVIANYTYSDGEGDLPNGSTVDLPGNSDSAYNLTGYYENEKFEVRLAYTYRDEFLAESNALGTTFDSFDERSFVDASATWHINENFDISVEGVNLTEEVTYQRFGGGLNSLRVASDNGSRYFVKLAYRN